MSDFQQEMNRTVQDFVAQITELARRAAIDTLEGAFGSKGRATALLSSAGLTALRPRGRGVKRSPDDLAQLSQRFAAFVKANPGLRIEQINKEMGTTTKDLALPIRKLIAEGQVVAKGKKRSTTYHPGKKAAKN